MPSVALPAKAGPNEFPRTILTRKEWTELRQKLNATEDGRKALKTLLAKADAALRKPPEFPDPKGPQAQVKSRNDEVAKAHDLLSFNACNLARAYILTGEKRYAKGAAEILRGYARLYQEYPEHSGVNKRDSAKVMAQRLSEAMWLIPLLMAYDLIYESGELGREDHQNIEDGLIRPAITMIWRKEPSALVAERNRKFPGWRHSLPPEKPPLPGNWVCFYNSATMLAGAVLKDQDMIDLAAANFRELIRYGIGDDGLWREGAMGYQLFAIGGMLPGLEAAARQGIDLWSFDGCRLKTMFDSPALYAYPDGTMPGINDSARVKATSWQTIVYDYAYLRYGDPRYASLVNQTPRQLHVSTAVYLPKLLYEVVPEAKVAEASSIVFDSMGYAILRNEAVYALMDYGEHGGVHGHFDKLNLLLFALGDEIGGEPVFHRYENPLHREWTVQSIAHNTMTVDQRSQKEAAGRLTLFETLGKVKVMRGAVDNTYPGVSLDRTVALLDGGIVDVYTGRGQKAHVWDRTFRFQGKLKGVSAQAGNEPAGERDGYQHLKVQGRMNVSLGWQGTWNTKGGDFGVVVAGNPGQELILAEDPDGIPLALVRNTGERATVAAFYAPGAALLPKVELPETGNPDLVAVRLEYAKENRETVLLIHHGTGRWKALGWDSDARVLIAQGQRDQVDNLFLGGGTFVNRGMIKVRLPDAGNAYVSVRQGVTKVDAQWIPGANSQGTK